MVKAMNPVPQLSPESAEFLIKKTDEVATVGHTERNEMAKALNELIAIVNHYQKGPQNAKG